MDYGYPGNASYRHERPFDYFRIESSVSAEGLEHLSTRGLIAGTDYGAGRLGGIWGLYGTYDYFAPDDFRFSSTAVSFGTTLQASISESLVRAEFRACGRGLRRCAFSRPDGRARLPLRCRSAGTREPAIDRRAPGRSGSDRAGVLRQRRSAGSAPASAISSSSEMPRSPSVSIDGTPSASPINLPAAARTISSCRTRGRRGRRSASSTRSSGRAASARCGRPRHAHLKPEPRLAPPVQHGRHVRAVTVHVVRNR